MSTTTPQGDNINATVGDHNVGVAIGKNINQTINYYADARTKEIAPETLDAALAKLAELPLDCVPGLCAPPVHSRVLLGANPLFVGREEELCAIAAALKGGETVAVGQTAAATGMGGIGKTQLASAFVHRYGHFFQGGVFWLSMADPNAISAEVAACGLRMAELRTDYATLDLPTQVSTVLGAWQSPLPRLLVFDNCEEPELLAQWRPPVGGCRVLVTSRRSQWDDGLAVQALPLDTHPRPKSRCNPRGNGASLTVVMFCSMSLPDATISLSLPTVASSLSPSRRGSSMWPTPQIQSLLFLALAIRSMFQACHVLGYGFCP